MSMRYAFLGSTGVKISTLALGTMPFGGEGVDRALSRELFARSRDAGINLFDCADVYNGGESERILGELIADCRDEVVITSKAYFPTSAEGADASLIARNLPVRSVPHPPEISGPPVMLARPQAPPAKN